MFSLCSCRHTSLLVSLSLNVATKLTSVSISSNHFFNSTTLNPSVRTMSASSRSAFDVLMANASNKKNQPPKAKESSPRKRKTPSKPQSQTPDLPLPTENQYIVQNSSSCEIGGLKLNDSDSNQIQTSSSSNADKGLEAAAKKPKLSITPEESVSELKKKAVEFKANKAA